MKSGHGRSVSRFLVDDTLVEAPLSAHTGLYLLRTASKGELLRPSLISLIDIWVLLENCV